MTIYSGRCQCGAVSWRCEADVLWAGHCHCESCRRAAPAAFVSWMGFPRQAVEWDGDNLNVRETSPGVERGHCATCGTGMFYRSDAWPDEIHLYAATLDDPTLYKPQAHFHWAERLPWVNTDDGLPCYPGTADVTDPT